MIDAATIKMIAPWLTGNDEADAKMLKAMFKGVRMSIGEWRDVVLQVKSAN
jgi:hypothetical protein